MGQKNVVEFLLFEAVVESDRVDNIACKNIKAGNKICAENILRIPNTRFPEKREIILKKIFL